MDRILERRVASSNARVEQIVKEQFGLKFWRLKEEDRLRILRLEQWEEKYKVPLWWILVTLVPIWKKKFARYSYGAFGVKIPTLVGAKSEAIIRARILEEFPNGENVRIWRAQEQQWQWASYRQGVGLKEDWTNPLRAARDYQQRMQRERQARDVFEKVARRRHYRNNPWHE